MNTIALFYIYCFQRWKKELAKNREKLLGGTDRERDKKATEKEKEEKKDKKEVWCIYVYVAFE